MLTRDWYYIRSIIGRMAGIIFLQGAKFPMVNQACGEIIIFVKVASTCNALSAMKNIMHSSIVF